MPNLVEVTYSQTGQSKKTNEFGFSSVPIEERIKNAKNEATYLFTDVQKIVFYRCYNRNESIQ